MLDFFDEQKYVYANCNARINILDGPVRSGKTIASINAWIKYIGEAPPGDLTMTGKTNAALYRNIIRPMEEMLGDDMRYVNSHDNRIVQLWDREIFCYGANDERSEGKIRGGTFAGAYGDEITLWPESYYKMLMSRLSVKDSKFIGTTNPDNPQHWLKIDYIDRINSGEIDGNVFNWPIERNTKLPDEYIAAIKKEYTGLWYKRFILGQWCVAEGAIYDFFDESLHVGSIFPDPRYHIVSVDYGTGNPTSFGLYGVNPHTTPKVWRKRGYWWDSKKEGRQKTDAQYVDDMDTFLGKGTPEEIKPYKIIVDPSAASFKLSLMRAGYFVVDADNSVTDGIRTQAKMLQTGQYMISDHPSNAPCIKEYYGYIWDANAAKKGEDKPKKTGDHCLIGETLVDTTEGPIMIKDLVCRNGAVHCYDTISKKPTIRPFYNVRKTREKMRILKLDFKSGRVLYCTIDHKILAVDKWKLAKDLKRGEKVVSLTGDGFRDELKSITDTGMIRDTYCMTVEDVHNFSVNGGLIVANSKDDERYILHTEFGVDTLDLHLLTRM